MLLSDVENIKELIKEYYESYSLNKPLYKAY
jgi:hypothetical protein